jgi:flagellin-like hook-associated protein FlgL
MALNTYNKYNVANSRLSSSLARLSSGLRINRAADDAAGLAISEKMKAQIAGLEQASRNALDGNSLIMTAEGALSEVHAMLSRMRELAVQAANDTYTSSDRMTIQNEIEQLKEEIDRIASATQFNRKNLLDGSSSAIVSTDRLTTKVFMRDGLRVIDQFGQKQAGGGNYVIVVTGSPGVSEVSKSNIMYVKHDVDIDGNGSFNDAGDLHIGDIATTGVKLYDIREFWDSNGNFLLEEAKTITLMQGDGKRTSVTIYGSDTLGTLIGKLNTAIGGAGGLNQDALFASAPTPQPYVGLVTTGMASASLASGLSTVPGTLIIQSAVPGKGGALNFIGDDSILNALGLSVVRDSKETKFTATVYDAHDHNKVIAAGVQFEGNLLVGVLHPNVDVEISSTTSLSAGVAQDTNGFNVIQWATGASESTFVHLADRSMVFHVGPNSLQDVNAAIGNMSSSALGLDGVLVTTNPLANKAIRMIDLAVDKVSLARSKLGAIQNRLDHTVSNLNEMAQNLTGALSRIQDADMAKEMTEFTKNNIILQAATAMLAQANQLPQNVLQLLR